MVKFSIIVPIYKVQKYLDTCIESVLNQTYGNFELILVDDGSPDNSPAICEQYAQKDKRIKVIHKVNGGLVSARKAGAELAVGDYCICVDGDDWIDNDYCEKYAVIIDKYRPDVICSGFHRHEDNKNNDSKLAYQSGYYNRAQMEKLIFPSLIEDETGKYFAPTICGKACKTALYKRYQQMVDDKIKIAEDHACTKPLIAAAYSMYIMEDCLYNYRINNESMTKAPKPFDWKGPELVGKHFEANMDMSYRDFQQQVYRSVVHNLFNVATSQFNQRKSYWEIKKEIHSQLEEPYYKNAVRNCHYGKYSKGKMARVVLKYHVICLIYMYWKYMYQIK